MPSSQIESILTKKSYYDIQLVYNLQDMARRGHYHEQNI